MIKKTFNKFAAKTFVNKPKAHVLPPKAINLYFPNSINPEFKFLNLSNLSAIDFSIKEDKEKNQFILVSKMLAYNNSSEIDIAAFNTMEEAKTALNDVRVALHVPAKSFAKWVIILGMLCGLCCMVTMHIKGLHGLFTHSEKSTSSSVGIDTQAANSPVGMVMPSMPANVNPAQIPPPVNNGEIDKIINQLQEVKQLQSGMNAQQAAVQQQPQEEQVQQPQGPVNPADQLLNGLK